MGISPSLDLSTPDAASMLDGLVSVGIAQMARAGLPKGKFPVIRGIQSGRIRYERRDPNEQWQTWQQLLASGEGDCEDLTTATAAELLYNGIEARTYVYKSGPHLYHVVLSTRRWGILDPSRAAGMEGNG
jgi:hypothetical protein